MCIIVTCLFFFLVLHGTQIEKVKARKPHEKSAAREAALREAFRVGLIAEVEAGRGWTPLHALAKHDYFPLSIDESFTWEDGRVPSRPPRGS